MESKTNEDICNKEQNNNKDNNKEMINIKNNNNENNNRNFSEKADSLI